MTTRTVQVTEYGRPEVLQVREVPDPVPGPDQVRVDVQFVEVLFLDTQLRSGWGEGYFPMRPPWVPGTGVTGTIGAIGSGVEAQRIGTRVTARTGNEGAYAERVVVDAAEAVEVSDDLDGAVALAALHDGVLALDRLDRAGLRAGQRVLVTAAAGSLGHWFVPLAKSAGAVVVGAAGGPEKVAVVSRLGADVAVDYRVEDWTERAGERFDVVFDGTGGEIGRAAFARTRDGGLFFGHGAASGDFSGTPEGREITVVGVDVPLDQDAWRGYTRVALEMLGSGRVRPTIGQRVPLVHAADAHAAMAARTVVGKTVLVV